VCFSTQAVSSLIPSCQLLIAMFGLISLVIHPIWPLLNIVWTFCPVEHLEPVLPTSLLDDMKAHGLGASAEMWSASIIEYSHVDDLGEFKNISDFAEGPTVDSRRLQYEEEGGGSAFQGLGPIILVILFAYVYKTQVVSERPPWPAKIDPLCKLENTGFMYPWHGCLEDIQQCLHGWCCLPVLVADRWEVTGLMQYWAVVGMYVFFLFTWGVVSFITGMLAGPFLQFPALLFLNICLAMYLAQQRQLLRVMLDGEGDHMLSDFCCYLWCECCTFIQDARQVDAIQEVEISCWLNIQCNASSAPPMGQPVAVAIGTAQPVAKAEVVQPAEAVAVAQPVAAAQPAAAPAPAPAQENSQKNEVSI